MSNRLRRLARLFTATAAVTALAACGSSAAPGSASPSAASPSPKSAPPSAAASAAGVSAAPVSPQAQPAASDRNQTLAQVNIPYAAISISMMPVWMPLDAGLFKKYGLDVKSEYIATATTITQSLLAGQISAANASEEAVINADLSGADLVVIGSGTDKLLFSVYGSPKLSSIADLKGKKIGVSKIGTSTDFAAHYVLGKNHLEAGKDTAIIQIGGGPETLAGIGSGAIDAGVLSPPLTLKAKGQGLKELADLADYDLAFYQAPLIAKKSWIRDHHDEALNVMRAYLAGISEMYKDKQKTMEVIGKYTKTTDSATLEDSYQALMKVLPKIPLPKVDAIQAGLGNSTSPAAKTADPRSFIDTSLIDELQQSGFIDQLYR